MRRWLSKPAVGELLTYCAATVGAALAWSFALPLALLIGPMVTLSVLAQRFPSLHVSKPAYGLGLLCVGMALGQFFTPEILATWATVGPALAINAVSSLVGLFLGYQLLTRVFGHNPATAVFSGLPGGILTVLEVSHQSNAKTQDVLFFQIFRIVLGATTIPLAFSIAGYTVPSTGVQSVAQPVPISLHDVLWLVLGSLTFTWLGRRMRFPSAEISIPMLWSAVLYGSNVVSMTIPMWLPAAGFIVVGASVGTLLPRPGIKRLLILISQTVALFLVFCTLTLISAWLSAAWMGIHLPTGILAFSPASLTEMIAVAVSLNLDPALVASNNMFRMIFCSLLAPVLLVWVNRREYLRVQGSPI